MLKKHRIITSITLFGLFLTPIIFSTIIFYYVFLFGLMSYLWIKGRKWQS